MGKGKYTILPGVYILPNKEQKGNIKKGAEGIEYRGEKEEARRKEQELGSKV